ncbi:hypothetical protein LIA77_05813 [Sarocladium implicatum]|nr:hypothetical protein LIA77_05813 [Sarocladium implicatum]
MANFGNTAAYPPRFEKRDQAAARFSATMNGESRDNPLDLSSDDEVEPPPHETRFFVLAASPPPPIEVADFKSFLSGQVPINLLPLHKREQLCDRFKDRLRQASDQGIPLSDVQIGADCLPVWNGWNWDPEENTLTDMIQDQLAALSLCQDLGALLRKEIITKCTAKLREASELGVRVDEISLGPCLLPQWSPSRQLENEQPLEKHDSGYSSRASSFGAPSELDQVALAITRRPAISPFVYSSDNELGLSDADDADDEYDGEVEDEEDFWNSDEVVSGIRPEERIQDDDATQNEGLPYLQDPTARLRNGIYRTELEVLRTGFTTEESSPESTCPESEGPDQTLNNIIYDVEVTGGHVPSGSLDLELYLVDDSDAEDLPDLEMAIDQEDYEHHYGDHDVIDVEIPGYHVSCRGSIEPSDEENLPLEQEVLLRMGLRHGWVNSSQSRREQLERLEELVAAQRALQEKADALTAGCEVDLDVEMDDVEEGEQLPPESESDISEEGVTTEEEDDKGQGCRTGNRQEAVPLTSSAKESVGETSEVSEEEFEDVL